MRFIDRVRSLFSRPVGVIPSPIIGREITDLDLLLVDPDYDPEFLFGGEHIPNSTTVLVTDRNIQASPQECREASKYRHEQYQERYKDRPFPEYNLKAATEQLLSLTNPTVRN